MQTLDATEWISINAGEVAEWLKAHAWKACVL